MEQVASGSAVVFRGSKWLCHEYSLVLEARGIEHEALQSDDTWILKVPTSLAQRAHDEISSYSRERGIRRRIPDIVQPHSGAAAGVVCFVLILLLIAYCAGNQMFGADWLDLGALDAGARSEWWRAVTALTLHLDQEHLLGNALFGAVAGAAASRLLGPGLAWASILGAASLANYTEILIAPIEHRAVGASTAVFAALGLLSGMAWRQRLSLRERLWYRWAPLIAGVCLLTLLGAGNAHVDVLGHGLGFCFGLAVGWSYIRTGIANYRGRRGQAIAAACAVLTLCMAWFLALRPR
ncbi:MAG TPA: rhomboid family intramembrane serine protease [Steroidobacteraceae bacterium]|nr:rhomboid family intramembrane serine protease [Steroidobacteraceae bacterium]